MFDWRPRLAQELSEYSESFELCVLKGSLDRVYFLVSFLHPFLHFLCPFFLFFFPSFSFSGFSLATNENLKTNAKRRSMNARFLIRKAARFN